MQSRINFLYRVFPNIRLTLSANKFNHFSLITFSFRNIEMIWQRNAKRITKLIYALEKWSMCRANIQPFFVTIQDVLLKNRKNLLQQSQRNLISQDAQNWELILKDSTAVDPWLKRFLTSWIFYVLYISLIWWKYNQNNACITVFYDMNDILHQSIFIELTIYFWITKVVVVT